MKRTYLYILTFLILSCSSSNDSETANPEINPSQLITTVIITLIPENGGDALEVKLFDQDGFQGTNYSGQSKTFGVGQFNQTYIGSVRFLNENVDPEIDLTQEIIDNGSIYQVFLYDQFFSLPFDFEYLDPYDIDENSIGTKFKFFSNDNNCGLFTLSLYKFNNIDKSLFANGSRPTDSEDYVNIASATMQVSCE